MRHRLVEGDLRREDRNEHQASSGDRMLPRNPSQKRTSCRGQKTKTNARTCKGPKRTVANKKK
jgi:small subunit ribosomal protein S13